MNQNIQKDVRKPNVVCGGEISLTSLFLQVVRRNVWAVGTVPISTTPVAGCWPARDDRWAVVGTAIVLGRDSGDDGEDDNECNLRTERRTKRLERALRQLKKVRLDSETRTHHWLHFEFFSWVGFLESSKSSSFSKLLGEFDFEANWWILRPQRRPFIAIFLDWFTGDSRWDSPLSAGYFQLA